MKSAKSFALRNEEKNRIESYLQIEIKERMNCNLNFKLTFTKNYELMYFANNSYIRPFGDLLNVVMDTDWQCLSVDGEMSLTCWKQVIDDVLNQEKGHPALHFWLLSPTEKTEIKTRIEQLSHIRNLLLRALELMQDETRSEYKSILINYLESEFPKTYSEYLSSQKRSKNFFKKDREEIESIEKNLISFESDDLSMIIMKEFMFVCSGAFIIRKCARCRGYFWTEITNKIYCSRVLPNEFESCESYGFNQQLKAERTEAYELYWERRAQAFKRLSRHENEFRTWLNRTAVYQELAKNGTITAKMLNEVIDEIESEMLKKRA